MATSTPPAAQRQAGQPPGSSPTPSRRRQMDPLSLGASILLAVVFIVAVALLIGVFFFDLTISWPDFVVESETTVQKLGLMVLVVLLFVAVMTFILFVVDRPKNLPKWAVLLGFLGPTFVMIVFGLIWPGVSTTIQSFFGRADWADEERREFVGFDNYVQVFTQSEFLTVLRNTLLWVVLVPLLAVVIGMIYAVIVDRTRTEALSKALVFLPMAISMVGASIIWKFVYEFKSAGRPQIGIANQVLVWLGLDPYQFLLNAPWNTLFLIVVMIWIQTGFAMTVLSASIKAIPDDIIEAARLDGVTGLQMFRFVTVPSIRPAIVVVITTVAIVTLKVFDIVRTMTGGQFQTSVVANEFYTQSFTQFNFGLGAALAVVLFILVVPIIAYNVRQMRLSEEVR